MVESKLVELVVAGSNPVGHPIRFLRIFIFVASEVIPSFGWIAGGEKYWSIFPGYFCEARGSLPLRKTRPKLIHHHLILIDSAAAFRYNLG